MTGVRDFRRRINSITNMQQITNAMKMVAASRLHHSQEKAIASRPYVLQLKDVTMRLLREQPEDAENRLLVKRPVKKKLYVLFTADRGLCGSYNTNLNRTMHEILKEEKTPVLLITVGRRGRDYFRRIKSQIVAEFTDLGHKPTYWQAKDIARKVALLYSTGEVDEVNLLYSRFISVIAQTPVVKRLLPIEAEAELEPEAGADSEQDPEAQPAAVTPEVTRPGGSYIFEPTPQYVLDHLLPRYVDAIIYNALLENKASEQGAKTAAMETATENAKTMIDKYTMAMNRARQAAITTEISEIVDGAAALE